MRYMGNFMFRPKCTDKTKERLKKWREDGTWDDAINKVLDAAEETSRTETGKNMLN
jgi:hypothetical protein